jgi:hypothetical protein
VTQKQDFTLSRLAAFALLVGRDVLPPPSDPHCRAHWDYRTGQWLILFSGSGNAGTWSKVGGPYPSQDAAGAAVMRFYVRAGRPDLADAYLLNAQA